MPICSADSYCFEGRCVCNPPLRLLQKQCIPRSETLRQEGDTERANIHCLGHRDCPRGRRCSAAGRCQPCGPPEANARFGLECVRLDEFGGKFSGAAAADGIHNDGAEGGKEWSRRRRIHQQLDAGIAGNWTGGGERRREKAKWAQRPIGIGKELKAIGPGSKRSDRPLEGVERLFSAISTLLGHAYLNGSPSGMGRHQQENIPLDAVTNSTAQNGRAKRTLPEAKEKGKEGKNDGWKKKSQFAHQRLLGEPCSPGQICQSGTHCEDGHCKCTTGTKTPRGQVLRHFPTISC